MQERLALYDAFKQEPDQERALDLFRQIHQMAADEFEIIGISLAPNLVGVVKACLLYTSDAADE